MSTARRPALSLLTALSALFISSCASPETASNPEGSSQGTMIANTRAASGSNTSAAQEVAGDAEGILRRNGRLYYVKDQRTTVISGRQRVTAGLYLEDNGDVTLADGRRFKVREGYLVTPAGEVVEVPQR